MKRLVLLVLIIALFLFPTGCVESIINSRADAMIQEYTGNYTVKVSGTAGLNFAGEYEAWFFHFDPDTQSIVYTKDSYTVEGQVPEEYTFEAAATAIIFQKQTDDSWTTLRMEVWRDGKLLSWRETADSRGFVWTLASG